MPRRRNPRRHGAGVAQLASRPTAQARHRCWLSHAQGCYVRERAMHDRQGHGVASRPAAREDLCCGPATGQPASACHRENMTCWHSADSKIREYRGLTGRPGVSEADRLPPANLNRPGPIVCRERLGESCVSTIARRPESHDRVLYITGAGPFAAANASSRPRPRTKTIGCVASGARYQIDTSPALAGAS